MKRIRRKAPRKFRPGFFFPQRGQASASRAQLFWQCGQRGMVYGQDCLHRLETGFQSPRGRRFPIIFSHPEVSLQQPSKIWASEKQTHFLVPIFFQPALHPETLNHGLHDQHG